MHPSSDLKQAVQHLQPLLPAIQIKCDTDTAKRSRHGRSKRVSDAVFCEIAVRKGGNRQISAGAPLYTPKHCKMMKVSLVTVAPEVLQIPVSCNTDTDAPAAYKESTANFVSCAFGCKCGPPSALCCNVATRVGGNPSVGITALVSCAGRWAHLDGALQHLREPEGVQEIEDEVHAANDPEHCGRYTARPRVRPAQPHSPLQKSHDIPVRKHKFSHTL